MQHRERNPVQERGDGAARHGWIVRLVVVIIVHPFQTLPGACRRRRAAASEPTIPTRHTMPWTVEPTRDSVNETKRKHNSACPVSDGANDAGSRTFICRCQFSLAQAKS